MTRRALSLTEVMIALAIAVMVMVPVTSMFSISGQQVQKSRNFSFAAALARRISQHLMAMPFQDIVDIPGQSIHDAPDDGFFNPLLNFANDQSGLKRIKAGEMPSLHGFLEMNDFKYALSVSNVSFGDGDEIKSIAIFITWKETGRDMIYRTHIYVSSV